MRALSTQIRICVNPQRFLPDSKIFPSTRSVFKSNSPVHTHPMVSRLIHSKATRPTRCAAILVYCSVRDWTRFSFVIGFENLRIRRPHLMGFAAEKKVAD